MTHPTSLIFTEELAAIFGQPHLRIYDCATYLEPAPQGSSELERPVLPRYLANCTAETSTAAQRRGVFPPTKET